MLAVDVWIGEAFEDHLDDKGGFDLLSEFGEGDQEKLVGSLSKPFSFISLVLEGTEVDFDDVFLFELVVEFDEGGKLFVMFSE